MAVLHHSGPLAAIAFSPDGTHLAVAGGARADLLTGEMRIWDLASRKQVMLLHRAPPTEPLLMTHTRPLCVPNRGSIGRAQEVRTLSPTTGPPNGLAFSPDGQLLASLAEGGTLRLDVVPIDDLIALAHRRLNRGFTDDECRRCLHLDRCPDR